MAQNLNSAETPNCVNFFFGLTSVENENIIYNSFLSIAFTTPEDYQVLAPLCRRMAVSCRWRRSIKLLLPSCSSRLDHLSLSYVARRLAQNIEMRTCSFSFKKLNKSRFILPGQV